MLCSSHLHSDRNSVNRAVPASPGWVGGTAGRGSPKGLAPEAQAALAGTLARLPLHHLPTLPPPRRGRTWVAPVSLGLVSAPSSRPAGTPTVQGGGWAPAWASGVRPPRGLWGSDSRLSIGCVLLPRTHPRHTQNCRDLLLGVRVALQEDGARGKCRPQTWACARLSPCGAHHWRVSCR